MLANWPLLALSFFLAASFFWLGQRQARIAKEVDSSEGLRRERALKEELQMRQQVLDKLLENINETLWTITLDEEKGDWFSDTSRNTRALLGIDRSEIIGLSVQQFAKKYFLPEDLHLEEKRGKERKTQPKFEYTSRIKRPDNGEVCWIRIKSFPLIEEGGRASKLLALIEDVSEKRRLQSQLVEEQLRSMYSSRMASLGVMASGISDEIKNPLFQIRGAILVLKKRLASFPSATNRVEAEKTMQSLCESIDSGADKIFKVVAGLQHFAAQEDQEVKQYCDLLQLVKDSEMLCRKRFAFKGVDLKVIFDSSSLIIFCHPSQIVRVLVNLLSNSLEACKERGQVLLSASTEASEKSDRGEAASAVSQDADFVLVRVEDNGHGIPPEAEERIKEPFFTTKEVGEGVGLGLSIADGIAREHGGSLSLTSRSSPTIFELRLPLQKKVVKDAA